MTKKTQEDFLKLMMQVFNNGCEQVIFPRLEMMQEEIQGKIEESERRIKKELREEFRAGQQSLSNTIEEVGRKVDQIVKEHKQSFSANKDFEKRLDKVERILKAN